MYNTPPNERPSENSAVPPRYNTRANARSALAFEIPSNSPRPPNGESNGEGPFDRTMNLDARLSLPGPLRPSENVSAEGARAILPNLSEPPPPLINNTQDISSQITVAMTSMRKDVLDLLRSELAAERRVHGLSEPVWPQDLPPLARDFRQENQLNRFSVPPPSLPNGPAVQPPPPVAVLTTDREGRVFTNTTQYSPRESNHRNAPTKPSIMSTWGIKFSGKNSVLTVEDFLFRVERLASASDVREGELCSNIHLLLREDAEGWFWNQFCRNSPSFGWEGFKRRISREFGSTSTDLDLMRALMELRQGSETSDAYIRRAGSLISRMCTQPPERALIQIIRDGLNPRISQQFSTTDVTSIDQLQDLCRRAEHWIVRRDMSRRTTRVEVHELMNDWTDTLEEAVDTVPTSVEEMTRSINKTTSMICWNCRKAGHSFHDCPSETRKLFCYRCGQPGVVTPKCPKCTPGNGSASGHYRGPHSPTTATKATSTSP